MAKTFQGTLCRRGHDDGTGHSVRYNLRSNCVECKKEKYRERDKEQKRNYYEKYKEQYRGQRLNRKYNITPDDKIRMFFEQDGACVLCGKFWDDVWVKDCNVDHDHKTNEVRWLLCGDCNRGLGMFRDSPQLLRKAADLVERALVNK